MAKGGSTDREPEDVGGPGDAPGGLLGDADATRAGDDRGSGDPSAPTQPSADSAGAVDEERVSGTVPRLDAAEDGAPARHAGDTPGTGAAPGSHERPVPEPGAPPTDE